MWYGVGVVQMMIITHDITSVPKWTVSGTCIVLGSLTVYAMHDCNNVA